MKSVKRVLALALALTLTLSLTGCGGSSGEAAPVQSVAMLMGVDLSGGNQYAGIVEAAATIKVEKDPNKTVEDCFVEVGDQVKAGDLLFTYDTDALEITLSTAELEVEQLKNSIASYEAQISALEKDKKKAPSSEKLTYTLQIQEAQLNKSEAEYNLKQKEGELARLKEGVGETEVYAAADGLIQAINDPDSSNNNDYYGYGYGSGSGQDSAYITIMEVGTYRIKATVSEETIYNLYEGMEMTAYSRTDSTRQWAGAIESINTSSAEEQNNNGNYYSNDGESSSKYAFYVSLESSEGLLIGQHVYLKMGRTAGEEESAIALPSGYLMDASETSAQVWVADGEKLAKREVSLGGYDESTDCYTVTEGLALEDYIAYPEASLTAGMSVIKYDDGSFGGYAGGEVYPEEEYYPEGGEVYPEEEYFPEGDGAAEEDYAADLGGSAGENVQPAVPEERPAIEEG